MIRVLLARHGETEWNSKSLIQGVTDLPLNDAGRKQVSTLKTALQKEKIDTIVTSPLIRAEETARIIAHGPVETIISDDRLKEVNFGKWEGKTVAELEFRFPAEIQTWYRNANFAPPEGESMKEAMQRAKSFLQDIQIEENKDKTFLLIGHGALFQGLICSAMGILPNLWWPFHIYTASISELLLYEDGATLISLNCLDHLEKAGISPDSVKGR